MGYLRDHLPPEWWGRGVCAAAVVATAPQETDDPSLGLVEPPWQLVELLHMGKATEQSPTQSIH